MPDFQPFSSLVTLNGIITKPITVMKKLLVFLLPLALCFVGCSDTDDIENLDVNFANNIPVTTNTANAFSYVVRAKGYSQQINSSLNFDSTAFVMSLVIAEYSEGEMGLAVYNEDSSQVYQQQISSNMVLTDFPEFLPTALNLNLDDFSGSVTVTMAVE